MRFPLWRTLRARRARRALTCRELVALVTDYLENALDPDERLRMERHLAACDGCKSHLEQMRQTLAVLGALGPQDPFKGAARDLAPVLEALRARRRWPPR